LSAASVEGAFDPGDDRDAQFLPGAPRAPVQDVLLKQGEEGFHRRVVTGSADASHRSDQAVAVKSAGETAAAKLASPIASNHAAGDLAAAGDGVLDGFDGQALAHPVADRVADDPVGADVLDRGRTRCSAGCFLTNCGSRLEPEPEQLEE